MIIVQLSDVHITEGNDAPSRQFERIVAQVMALPSRPDVVIVTGDCTEHGLPNEYEQFQALLRPLTMPVYVIPGNHDHRENFLAVFGTQGERALPGFAQYTVEGMPVRLVALDTHIPGMAAGELCDQRRAWLRDRLAEAPEQPTLLFMHHPPIKLGLPIFDAIGFREPPTLGAIVRDHSQIEVIVAGHVHTQMSQRFYGSMVVVAPASAQHMLPDWSQPDRIVVQIQPPSFLLHIWSDATRLLTIPSMIGDHGAPVMLHDGTGWV